MRELVAVGAPVHRGAPVSDGLLLLPKLIEEYCAQLGRSGVSAETASTYKRKLFLLYDRLEEDHQIRPGTLDRVVDGLLAEGSAPGTVNVFLAAADGLLEYAGRRDLQHGRRLRTDAVRPELTRNEYLRLLGAARALGKERTYLIVKCSASLGLDVHPLMELSVEAVRSGVHVSGTRIDPIPACLKEELLTYARERGIVSGPIFLTEEGTPMKRTSITSSIGLLAEPARVSPSKCNVRCLKRLYEATQEEIRQKLAPLLEGAHTRLLEQEQRLIGWKAG